MKFSERLRAVIKGSGKTQKEIGEKAGVSPATLNNYLRGAYSPTFDFLQVVAQECGTSIAYLAGETDDGDCSAAQNSSALLPSLRLRDAFKVLGSPEEVARDVEATPKQVRDWISGKTQPSPHQLALLFNEMARAAATLMNALAKTYCAHEDEGLRGNKLKSGTNE